MMARSRHARGNPTAADGARGYYIHDAVFGWTTPVQLVHQRALRAQRARATGLPGPLADLAVDLERAPLGVKLAVGAATVVVTAVAAAKLHAAWRRWTTPALAPAGAPQR